mmetsp:Transcript_40065/g.82079  ORF Transcript_40065/g.82079 Transcript_40065/m.82079 type:complete len:187 (+) Transcript_40065:59-619(+)
MSIHRISSTISPLHKPKARQRRCVVKSIEHTKELNDFLDHVGRCPMDFQKSVEYYRKMADESRQTEDIIAKISGHPPPPSDATTRVSSDAMSMSRVNSVASASASMRSHSNSTVRFNTDASTGYSRLVSGSSTISQGDGPSHMQSSFLSSWESGTATGAGADAALKDVSSCHLRLLPKGERAIVSI